jgi:hypothetical protein
MPRIKRNPSVEYVSFTFRIPATMKKSIEERAIKNLRSTSQEAEFLLRTALEILEKQDPQKANK